MLSQFIGSWQKQLRMVFVLPNKEQLPIRHFIFYYHNKNFLLKIEVKNRVYFATRLDRQKRLDGTEFQI